MKTCTRCKVPKEFSAFYRDTSHSDGYSSRCQDCTKTAVLEWQKKYPEKHNAKGSKWIRNNRDRVNASVRKTDQKYRTKRRARTNAYRAKNPEKWRKINRQWAHKHPHQVADHNARRRAIINQSPIIEKIDRLAIYERDQGRCHICKRPCSRKTFTLDHLIPLSKGGFHIALNLAVAHRSCNSRRGPGHLPAQLLLLA